MVYRWKRGAPRVAFVTGAASGLGKLIATKLRAEGADLALFDLSFPPEIRAQIEATPGGGKIEFLTCDMAQSDAVHAAVSQAINALGAPDLALNAAGINLTGRHHEMPQDEFRRVIEVNLMGTQHFARAVLPHMQAGAHLTLIASLAGKVGNYAYGAYCASKFGVVGLAEVLRIEMIERDIDVSVICPAEIETPMVEVERQTMLPMTRKLKAFAGVMQAEPAAEIMVRGMARRKPLIIPGFRGKFTNFMSRVFPGLSWIILRKMVVDELRDAQRR